MPPVGLGPYPVCLGQYGPFGKYGPLGTMPGPSCCISVPFMFKNVLTKDQASIEGISSISSPFGPVSGPFGPIWSIFAHGIL